MSDSVPRTGVDGAPPLGLAFGKTSSAHAGGASRRRSGKLVLTPQLRVTKKDVLVLRPENAVDLTQPGQHFADPQEREVGPKDRQGGSGKGGPLLLKNAIPVARGTRKTDVKELTAKIVALETAIANTEDQWEPDEAGRDAYSGTKMPGIDWPCDVELDATGQPMKPPSDLVLTAVEEKETATSADPKLDEEALRRMVSEIVREELQGALGERLTRKLQRRVRREIDKALLSRQSE